MADDAPSAWDRPDGGEGAGWSRSASSFPNCRGGCARRCRARTHSCAYRIRRAATGLEVIQDPGLASRDASSLDVRSLVAPRFLSQRQIARVARNPASQRRELDALIESNRLRTNRNERQLTKESLAQHQTTRDRLSRQAARLPVVETELQTVNDQIMFLQGEGRKEVFERFDEFERQRTWLHEQRNELSELAARLEREASTVREAASSAGPSRKLALETAWLESVARRVEGARERSAEALREQAASLRTLEKEIAHEQGEQWQAGYDRARSEYEGLREELVERGIDFDRHEHLLERRGELERELASLRASVRDLDDIVTAIRDARLQFVEAHEARLQGRREQADSLEAMDADVRLEVLPFRDREDFESRREEWFGGAGLQERDWTVLCNYVSEANGQVPERIATLAEAIRSDIEATCTKQFPSQRHAMIATTGLSSTRWNRRCELGGSDHPGSRPRWRRGNSTTADACGEGTGSGSGPKRGKSTGACGTSRRPREEPRRSSSSRRSMQATSRGEPGPVPGSRTERRGERQPGYDSPLVLFLAFSRGIPR